jgi:subtilisin family serine protease
MPTPPVKKKVYVGVLKKAPTPSAMDLTVKALSSNVNVKVKSSNGEKTIVEFEASDKDLAKVKGLFARLEVSQTYKIQIVDVRPKVALGGFEASMRTTIPFLGFEKIWADPEFDGGRGIKIAVIDTGMDNEDGRFGNRIEEAQSFIGGGVLHQHGKWVGSIYGRATGKYDSGQIWRGGLYNCTFFDARVLGSEGQGTTGTVAAGMQWAISKDVDIMSMSLGGAHSQILDDLVADAWAKGIIVCCASGNGGVFPPPCCGTMICPADAPYALAVGATSGGKGEKPEEEAVQTWTDRNPIARDKVTIQKNYDVASGLYIITGIGDAGVSGTSLSQPHKGICIGANLHKLKRIRPEWIKQQRAIRAIEHSYATCKNLGYA